MHIWANALLVFALWLQEPQRPPIEYTVSLNEPQTQMVNIRMLVRNVTGSTLDVAMPVWRPGRYEILDPAGSVREVRAAAGSGTSLPVAKTDKSTWRVTTNGAREVQIFYRVYANSLADRTRHVDDTHAFLSGAAVFFYIPDRRKDSILVNIEAPANWRVATGLDAAGDNPRRLTARDYDVLADSPLEIGIHDLISFEVNGKPHEIAIWGGAKYDAEKLKADFAKIIRNQAGLFGEMPYRRYVFLIHVGPDASGGTEHLNSTIIQASRRALENDEAYKTFLGTVAHEYFHTWNVKQFRPAGIHPYDYTRENYTDLLWVAEGTTSYYDDLTLARAGLMKPDDYLKALGDAIHSMRNRPGAQLQSLTESSFDAWVKFNQPTPDDANSTVSFYSVGALASLLMDMELRNRARNEITLDAVMREMYRRFPLSGPGYTKADLISTLERMSGFQWERFFDNYIDGTEEYPLEAALKFVGLELAIEPEKKDDKAKQKPYAGLNLTDRNGGILVRSVISDGPAYAAGIMAGDEIVAVNGRRISASQFEEFLGRMQIGDTATLHFIRRDELRNVSFKLAGKPNGRWKVVRVKSPTDAQKRAYQSWLQQEWPKSSD